MLCQTNTKNMPYKHVICRNCKQICVRGICHKEKQKVKLVKYNFNVKKNEGNGMFIQEVNINK